MTDASRRSFLCAGALLPLAASAAAADRHAAEPIERDLLRYVGFGNKRAGGPGDMACGAWLAGELERAGYAVERQSFEVPFFDASAATLASGSKAAAVYPQPIVVPTGPGGVSGPLVRVDAAGRAATSLAGAIALVDLSFARWSSMLAKHARGPIEAAFAGGARAAVAITNGPTGQVIALNTDGRKPMFGGPVALLAPADADPFLAAAMQRTEARLTIDGKGGRRPAFNLVGRIDRGKGRWLAISTPRSGWFGCAAERGPGVAAWLDLARWAAGAMPDHDLAFICNTGHEYEYLGAAEAMKRIAPPPAATRFWLHIGANVAARDWHEIPGHVAPLPSVDPQRFLSLSPELLPLARALFAGQAGYEAPVSSAALSAGELDEVIKAGYAPAAGVFGIHRYHHVAADDERCLNLPATVAAAQGFRRLVAAVAGGSS
ncbi:hypothetical protein KNJ79_04160 [Sphingopyxis indica]|uniref:hypothetical protein n=1 Tax=Sphingopyxis indica TaxID=436663 RepID=UPI0029394D3F|nr:hypothetical protein [Sphingopyxis indica]WOF44141.1 hypothetical protein KNJ79_04160 [Sphingopyxis indica]